MSDKKKMILKLLWNNLKLLKEKGKSPDQTFDFLNENDMVKYLFNEETRYVELLLLSLDMQPIEMIEKLNQKFVSLYKNFFEQEVAKEETVEATVKEEVVDNQKEVVLVEEDDDESVVESEEQEELSDEEEDIAVKFIEKHLLETDDTDDKVSLELIREKYSEFCDDNKLDEDVEDLESSLVVKFGKPKGKKKPSYKGLKLV